MRKIRPKTIEKDYYVISLIEMPLKIEWIKQNLSSNKIEEYLVANGYGDACDVYAKTQKKIFVRCEMVIMAINDKKAINYVDGWRKKELKDTSISEIEITTEKGRIVSV